MTDWSRINIAVEKAIYKNEARHILSKPPTPICDYPFQYVVKCASIMTSLLQLARDYRARVKKIKEQQEPLDRLEG